MSAQYRALLEGQSGRIDIDVVGDLTSSTCTLRSPRRSRPSGYSRLKRPLKRFLMKPSVPNTRNTPSTEAASYGQSLRGKLGV